jgi:hypothetical protein
MAEAEEILSTHNAPVTGNMRGKIRCTSCGEFWPCVPRWQAGYVKAGLMLTGRDELPPPDPRLWPMPHYRR